LKYVKTFHIEFDHMCLIYLGTEVHMPGSK